MTADTSAGSNDLVGWRRGVDRAFVYLVTLFFVGVLAQVFLAGVGAFGDHALKVLASYFGLSRHVNNTGQ